MARKLSNQDRLAINNGLSANKTIAQLAKQLDVKETLIQEYLDHMFDALAKVQSDRKKAAAAAADHTAGAAIITKTRDKKAGGVAVMTEAASSIADGLKNKTHVNNPRVVGTINPNKVTPFKNATVKDEKDNN